jgi:dihydrofolate reductase
MYETMLYWETVNFPPGGSAIAKDFQGIWLAAQKIVYSRTLESVASTMTRVDRNFEADAIRHMKDSTERDISIGGPNLAGQALKLGLVDELRVFVLPVVIGGGKSWLPSDLRLNLRLGDTRRFPGGSTYASYYLAT